MGGPSASTASTPCSPSTATPAGSPSAWIRVSGGGKSGGDGGGGKGGGRVILVQGLGEDIHGNGSKCKNKNSDDICGNAADNTHNSDDRIMMIES